MTTWMKKDIKLCDTVLFVLYTFFNDACFTENIF